MKIPFISAVLILFASFLPAVPVHLAVPALGDGMNKLKQWTPLVTYLEQECGLEIDLVITRDNGVIMEGLESKNYDLAFIDPFWYIYWNDKDLYTLLVQAEISGSDKRKIMLVVHRDSVFRSIKDLRNRKVAFTLKNESAEGFYLPMALMVSKGIDPFNFFKESMFAETFSSIIKSVAYGKLDAGFITSNVYLSPGNKTLSGVLRVISETDPIPQWVLIGRSDYSKEKMDAIKYALILLQREEEGREILEDAGFSGFISVQDKDLSVMDRYIDILENYHAAPE